MGGQTSPLRVYVDGAILPQGRRWDVRLAMISVEAAEVYILKEEDAKCLMRYIDIN